MFNAIVPNVYISSISYCIKMHKTCLLLNVTEKILASEHNLSLLSFIVMKLMLFVAKKITHGKNSVIMNSLLIENIYLFPELTVVVVK